MRQLLVPGEWAKLNLSYLDVPYCLNCMNAIKVLNRGFLMVS
jgi:hypothetical protein